MSRRHFWHDWCDRVGTAHASSIEIELSGGRRHRVDVIVHDDDSIELSGLVTTDAHRLPLLDRSRSNRGRSLTALVADEDNQVWVTALLPPFGASAEEFQLLARAVAEEADRLEYLLSGTDEY